MFDLSNYSNFQRLTEWINRFIQNVISSEKLKGELSAEEMRNALDWTYWILKTEQKLNCRYWKRAIKELQRNSKLLNLNPFLDNFGILRVGGRKRVCYRMKWNIHGFKLDFARTATVQEAGAEMFDVAASPNWRWTSKAKLHYLKTASHRLSHLSNGCWFCWPINSPT